MRILVILAAIAVVGICVYSLRQKAERPIQVGNEAPNFSLTSISGETVSLEEFRDRSIVVICIGNPYT